MNNIFEWELDLIVLLQNTLPWLRTIMQFFTTIGEPFVYILVMLILIWCVDYRFGVKYATLILCSSFINSFSKILIRAPRPYFIDDRIHVSHLEDGYGMPSGHAQNSTVALITLSNYKNMTRFRIAFIAVIILIGLSRVYLGYHSPIQVLAGWIMGVCVIGIVYKFENPQGSSRLERIKTMSIKIKTLIILLLWLVSMTYLIACVNDVQMKIDYASKISIYMGTLIGIQWGSKRLSTRINAIQLDHRMGKLLARCLVGFPLVFALIYCVKMAEKHITDMWVSGTLQFILMIGVGLWVSYGAIIVFDKLSILKSED